MFLNLFSRNLTGYKFSGICLKNGSVKSGKIFAKSENEAKLKLLNNSIAVNQIEGVYSFRESKEVLDFFESLFLLIKSGMELVSAIETLSGEKEKQYSRITDLLEHIKKGEQLSFALNKTGFLSDPFIAALIKAGEKTGNLEKALESAIYYLKTMEDIKSKVLSATIYPLITLLVSIVTSVILLKYVVPVFVNLYKKYGDIELPVVTELLLNVSSFINNNFLILFVFFVLIVVSIKYRKSAKFIGNFFSNLFLRLPLINNVYKNLKGFKLFQILYILTEAEVELIEALEILRSATTNNKEQKTLDNTIKLLKQGNSYSTIVKNSNEFEQSVLSIIVSGEKTGNLKDAFNLLAQYFKKRFEKNITAFATIIEPTFLILISMFVGFILIALYLPMFNIVNVL